MFGNEPSFKRNIEKGHICVIRWLVACPGARAVRLPDLPFPCLIDHKAAVPPLFRWHGSSVARRHGRLFSLPLQPLDPLLQATGSGTWITIVCASGASFPSHRPPPHTSFLVRTTVSSGFDRSIQENPSSVPRFQTALERARDRGGRHKRIATVDRRMPNGSGPSIRRAVSSVLAPPGPRSQTIPIRKDFLVWIDNIGRCGRVS